MMKAAILGATALILAGCAGVSGQSSLAATCQQYGNALENLTIYKSEMSASQIATVNDVNAVAVPICTNLRGVEDPQTALFTLRDELRRLERIEREIE